MRESCEGDAGRRPEVSCVVCVQVNGNDENELDAWTT